MGTLTIRNLPEDVHDKLRLKAAKNRRSVEAEARAVIAEAVEKPAGGSGAWLGSMRGQIKVIGDWAEGDREVEALFEESASAPWPEG